MLHGGVPRVGRGEGLGQVDMQASLGADIFRARYRESVGQLLDRFMVTKTSQCASSPPGQVVLVQRDIRQVRIYCSAVRKDSGSSV